MGLGGKDTRKPKQGVLNLGADDSVEAHRIAAGINN